ncbi:MAG: prepilin-type N-terminal cleavage/methylation domain-containing protein [Polyangiales bacterium]
MTNRRHRSSKREGFTLIEVMLAAGLIMFGAVGIMALQQAAIRGNRQARQITAATEISLAWVERLQRQSVAWTSATVGGTQDVPYLTAIANQPLSSGWFVPTLPTNATQNEYPGRDWAGLENGDPTRWRYCTLVNLTWLNNFTSMRADVITWWPKEGMADQAVFPNCGIGANGAAIVAAIQQANSPLHSVAASTVLRWNPVVQ